MNNLEIIHPVWGEGVVVGFSHGYTIFLFPGGIKESEKGTPAELIYKRQIEVNL